MYTLNTMALNANIIENILKQYTNNIAFEGGKLRKPASEDELVQDSVKISENGKKRIMEKLKDEAIEHLKSKG